MERERPPVFPRLRGCGRDVWRANGVEEDLLCAGLARHRGNGLCAGEGLNRHTAVSKSYSEPFAVHGAGLFRGRKGATELSETLAAAVEGSVSFVETLLFFCEVFVGVLLLFSCAHKEWCGCVYIFI